MNLRLLALAVAVLSASGCVVHEHPRYAYRERPPRETVEVVAPQAPPVEVIEAEPAPRPGYVWARGYWHWNGNRYVATRGHWEPVRPGYHYVAPYWEPRGDGWHWHVGVWVNG
ncbi:hypothetical protein [Pseudomonas sp. NPDC007930]|uniref:hypothetical protein n=1 Tax=Pseudomonas sp. NPDC007930 TaxID=3364417 RepID=UPI0036E81BF3